MALPQPSLGRHLVSRPHTGSPRLARSHARTHERNKYDIPVGLTPQPPIPNGIHIDTLIAIRIRVSVGIAISIDV